MIAERVSDRNFVNVALGRLWSIVDRSSESRHLDPVQEVNVSSTGDNGGSMCRQVDLGLRYPIHMIEFISLNDQSPLISSSMAITFSDSGETWSEAEVEPQANDAVQKARIALRPGEACWTRYIRISFARQFDLDWATVRVWIDRSTFDLIVFRKTLQAEFDIVGEKPGQDIYRAYRFINSNRPEGRSLVGLALYEHGAFGNFIIQALLVIGIARNLNLKYVKLSIKDRSEVLDIYEPTEIGGITFLPASDPLPSDGYFLSGMFFDVLVQKLAGNLDQIKSRYIINSYIKVLFNRLPSKFTCKPDDQLLIHIRSGDIFSTWVAPHYPQPPLSFYKLVIHRLLSEKKISSIKMVFENRLNPVIAELEAYITQIGLPLITQSGTLADDVASLVNGRHLVFGLGTFGPGICHLSDHVEQVFFFASGWPQHFSGIPTIEKVIEVLDVRGDYTKVGEWDNSDERRQMMIDYPEEFLAFDDTVR